MRLTNRDLLDWFSEDEREQCGYCGERARVSLAEVPTTFCLACGAVTSGGIRLDVERQLVV